MRRIVSSILVLLFISLPVLSGCTPKEQAKKPLESPYTFDYKTGKGNAGFFAQGDTANTLKAASPFYMGAQPLPTGRGAAFVKLKESKVKEIEKEAGSLVKKTEALKIKLAKVRSAYVRFLDKAIKEEPKLKEYSKETLSRLSVSRAKETFTAAEYRAIHPKTRNRFADSYAGYLKVSKAVELGSIYLEDSQNVVGFASAAYSGLADHPSPQIKAARAELDKEMASFDGMRGDIKSIQQSMAKIDYGQRQIETADYYLAKEGLRFMAANLPGVKAKAKSLKVRPGLTKKDIKFIRSYVQVMSKMEKVLTARLNKIDKKRLIPVKVKKKPVAAVELVPYAYAADDLPFVSGAADTLQLPLDAGPAQPPISGWDILKVPGKLARGLKTTGGVILDAAGVTVQNITRAGYGIYHGEPAKGIWSDMKKNTRVITENFNKGVSGSSTLKTAGEYLEGTENAAGETAASGVEKTLGKGWTSWAVGGFTKLVVGTFTGLGKGIYKVSKTDATTTDMVGGTLDIGLSMIGGSKTIFNGEVLATLGKEGLLTAAGGWTFLKGLAVNADKQAVKKAMAKLLSNPKLTQAEVVRLLRGSVELEAKEMTAKILKEMRAEILKEMKEALKSGGKAGLAKAQTLAKESLEGLFQKAYEANLTGIREMLGDTLGKDLGEFTINIIAGNVDGFLSAAATEILAGSPDPAELNGQWKGTFTVTDVIAAPGQEGSKGEKPEGCDLNIDLNSLKGKTLAIDWTVQLDEAGNGTLTGSGNGMVAGGVPMAVRYSGGAISGSASQKGATVTMAGEFKRGEESGYSGAGTMNTSYGALKILGSWTVSK